MPADPAEPLHGDPAPGHVGGAEHLVEGGADPGEHPAGGQRGRVAGAPEPLVDRPHEVGLAGDVDHLLGRGAQVGTGAEAAGEQLHEPPEGPQQHPLVGGAVLLEQHRLAAAAGQVGEGELVGHALGEPQGVLERVLLGGVRLVPGAAAGRAEGGVVDGDDRPHPGLPVEAEHHLLVAVLGHLVEDAHIALLRSWSRRGRGGPAQRRCRVVGGGVAPPPPHDTPWGGGQSAPGPGGRIGRAAGPYPAGEVDRWTPCGTHGPSGCRPTNGPSSRPGAWTTCSGGWPSGAPCTASGWPAPGSGPAPGSASTGWPTCPSPPSRTCGTATPGACWPSPASRSSASTAPPAPAAAPPWSPTPAPTSTSGPRSAPAPSAAPAPARGPSVHNAYGYGLFTGGLGMHAGAELMGCTLVPVSGGQTQRQVTLLRDLRPEVLCCTPSYAARLGEALAEAGVATRRGVAAGRDLRGRALERGHARPDRGPAAAEGARHLRPLGDHRSRGGLRVRRGPGRPARQRGPLPGRGGRPGLGAAARAGGAGRAGLHHPDQGGHAAAALPHRRHRRPRPVGLPLRPDPGPDVQGDRAQDDMLVIRGVNVYPSEVEAVLVAERAVAPHYLLVVDRTQTMPRLVVACELAAGWSICAETEEAERDRVAAEVGGRPAGAPRPDHRGPGPARRHHPPGRARQGGPGRPAHRRPRPAARLAASGLWTAGWNRRGGMADSASRAPQVPDP